jgi:hypothetical protein
MSGNLKTIGTSDSSSDAEPARAENESLNGVRDLATDQKSFGIRLADTEEGRNSASLLINRMYSWRGYAGTHKIEENPNRITLTARDKEVVVGTLTLGLDSPLGILADDIFKEEIDRFRHQGARICEITKLAFDPAVRSNMALASLFHLAAIYARHLHDRTDIFIEVNPRHRRFYEQMLGFQRLGEAKINTRVNAPAYLLAVNLDYVDEQIKKFGGTSSHPGAERSFYPLFFSPREEAGIIDRLKMIDH